MRDRQILEYPEKMCEYCCNFDKEHIGMDCTALCKLTMTLAYAEDYGGSCMFYNVPREQIIVPPCKVGDTIYLLQKYYGTYCFNIVEDKAQMIGITSRGIHIKARNHHDHNKMYMLGKTVFLTREEAEQKLRNEDNGK